jgi:hypothetical protein
VDVLSKSKWWQASQGRDHVLVVHHPNAFRYSGILMVQPHSVRFNFVSWLHFLDTFSRLQFLRSSSSSALFSVGFGALTDG